LVCSSSEEVAPVGTAREAPPWHRHRPTYRWDPPPAEVRQGPVRSPGPRPVDRRGSHPSPLAPGPQESPPRRAAPWPVPSLEAAVGRWRVPRAAECQDWVPTRSGDPRQAARSPVPSPVGRWRAPRRAPGPEECLPRSRERLRPAVRPHSRRRRLRTRRPRPGHPHRSPARSRRSPHPTRTRPHPAGADDNSHGADRVRGVRSPRRSAGRLRALAATKEAEARIWRMFGLELEPRTCQQRSHLSQGTESALHKEQE